MLMCKHAAVAYIRFTAAPIWSTGHTRDRIRAVVTGAAKSTRGPLQHQNVVARSSNRSETLTAQYICHKHERVKKGTKDIKPTKN